MAEPITWTTTDASGVIRHRPATEEVLTLFKQAYLAESLMPVICTLQALQDQTDNLGIPWISVMAGVTALLNDDLLESFKLEHSDVLDILKNKGSQEFVFTGAKRCAWCGSKTLVLIQLLFDGGGAMVCGSCAAEYEYLVTNTFYQPTSKAVVRFYDMRAKEGGSDANVKQTPD